jgi:hypothetical protein
MRYYHIQIGNPTGGVVTNMLTAQGGIYTSHPNGPSQPPDPGALNVELQIVDRGLNYAVSGSFVRIWGVSLTDISQSRALGAQMGSAGTGQGAGFPIVIRGGMGKGLPLANPAEAGILVSGTIQQAFGNWVGVNQSLDLILVPPLDVPPSQYQQQAPNSNISWNWVPNTPMSVAIAQALSVAYPTYKQQIDISPNLKRPNLETGFYANLTQFSQYVYDASLSIMNSPSYKGVTISVRDDAFVVTDGTQATASSPVKTIAFTDLIGQPTWIDQATIQVTCVMRGDVHVNDLIKLPPGPVFTTPNSYANIRTGSIFQGTFLVAQIQHVGNFRQPEAQAWVTVIEAKEQLAPAATSTPAGNVTIEDITIQ